MRNRRLLFSTLLPLLLASAGCNSDPDAPMGDLPLEDPSADCTDSKECPPPECKYPWDCEHENGCTLTQGYWKNHPDDWPVDWLPIGYKDDLIELILEEPVAGDARAILLYQYIAAKLNMLAGADSSDVDSALYQAEWWLMIHDVSGDPVDASSEEGQDAIEIAGELADFNEGSIGPGHCSGETDPVVFYY